MAIASYRIMTHCYSRNVGIITRCVQRVFIADITHLLKSYGAVLTPTRFCQLIIISDLVTSVYIGTMLFTVCRSRCHKRT